jgi:hypothetical protein
VIIRNVFQIVLLLTLIFSIIAATPVDAQKGIGNESGTVTISNGIYDVSVQDKTGLTGLGTYTVSTGTWHPLPNQDVLFAGVVQQPWSTYLTVRSYNTSTEYVSTSSSPTPSAGYNVVNLDTVSATGFSSPTPTSAVAWWDLNTPADPDDLYIEQVIEVVGTTLADSRVRVSTEVTNTGAEPVDIGIRYEWDIVIDGFDGSWFAERNPDGPWIDVENEWTSPAFERFETTNDLASPMFSIFGTVTGSTTFTPPPTPPDLLQFAAWGSSPSPGLFAFAFDFTPTARTVAGPGLDSAVAYYWGNTDGNAIRLNAGKGVIVTQYLVAANTCGLAITSTAGGSVTTPGEGTFTYDPGTVVSLNATPDAGYHFVNWAGDVGTIANVNAAATTITMNGNYSITANFKKGGCFIATAAYGTPMAEEIEILREFRDEYLLTNSLGQALVEFYYRVSPPIAEFITEHPSLKPIVRAGLVPAVVMSTIAVSTTVAEKMVIVGLLVLVSVALAVWAKNDKGRRARNDGLSC